MRQLIVALAVLTVSALAAQDGPQTRDPLPGDVKLSLAIVPAGRLGVTWEPVVAVLTFANQTADQLSVGLGASDLQFTVRDPAGKVFRTPVVAPEGPRVPIGMVRPGLFLGAQMTSRPEVRILNPTCPFSTPGAYEVSVILSSRKGEAEPVVVATAAATYTAREGTPEDYRWLASVLASWQLNPIEDGPALAQECPRPDWREGTPLGQEMTRLRAELLAWFLRDEAVEPLAQLAYMGDSGREQALVGLRRLNTPRARALLEALAASTDRSVAERARAVLAQPEPRRPEGGVSDAK